jgi:WD40 repeat protein
MVLPTFGEKDAKKQQEDWAAKFPPLKFALPPPAKELEALRRDKIPPEALALAGDGDPKRAPASLVAVLGEARPIHTKRVSSLAFSSDGRWLASGSDDQTIILAEAATGRVSRVFKGHTAPVTSVAFSKDCKTVISASRDGTMKLWPTDTVEEPITLQPNLGEIGVMAASPNGQFLAAKGTSGALRLWKWGDWKTPRTINDGMVAALAFSSDGEFLACGADDNKPSVPIRIYKTSDGKLAQTLTGHANTVGALAFSRDGKSLVSAGRDRKVIVWKIATGKPVAEIATRTIGCLAFSPDGNTLALGNDIWKVDVLHVPTQTILHKLAGVDWLATAMAFSPDGKSLAIGAGGGGLCTLDTTHWQQQHLERGHRHYVTALAVNPDGRTVLSGGNDLTSRLWDLRQPAGNQVVRQFPDVVTCVAYSPDGKTFAVGINGGGIVFDTATSQERFTVATDEALDRLVFSPDGTTLAGVSRAWAYRPPRPIRIWDMRLGKEMHRFPSHGRETGLAFNADGKLLAATFSTNVVKVWDMKNGAEVRSWIDTGMVGVAFRFDNQTLAIGHANGTISVWDLTEGEKKRTLAGHGAPVTGLKFTPDGKTLVSSGADGTIRLWDPNVGQARQVISLGQANSPLTFDLDGSGKYLFAAGNSPVIYVLRLPEGV